MRLDFTSIRGLVFSKWNLARHRTVDSGKNQFISLRAPDQEIRYKIFKNNNQRLVYLRRVTLNFQIIKKSVITSDQLFQAIFFQFCVITYDYTRTS